MIRSLPVIILAAAARTAAAEPNTVGVDAVGVVPVSAYGDAASAAFGVDARVASPLTDSVAGIARVGYVQDADAKVGIAMDIVPLLVGARYRAGTSGLFVDAELGASVIHESGMGASLTNARFAFQVGAGYQTGKLQARLGFWVPGTEQLGNGLQSTLEGILASVGYDFASL